MAETTTTEEAASKSSESQGSELEDAAAGAAEAKSPETHPDQSGAEAESASASALTDEDREWLKNKGVDPNDAKAVAAAWRTAEQEFHKQRQDTKSQLREETEAAVRGDGGDDARLRALEVRVAVRDFYDDNPDAKDLDEQMAKIVKQRPHLASDLDAVYAMAKLGGSKTAEEAAENRGREAAKAEIGRSSAAKSLPGNANSGGSTSKWTRERIAVLSTKEYAEHRAEIKAAIASGEVK